MDFYKQLCFSFNVIKSRLNTPQVKFSQSRDFNTWQRKNSSLFIYLPVRNKNTIPKTIARRGIEMNNSDAVSTEETAFKKEFKYFKAKKKRPDLSRVIDFCKPLEYPLVKTIAPICHDSLNFTDNHIFGLRCASEWKIYTITGKNGFYFISNPFTTNGQQMWIQKSLDTYLIKPSKTNLDTRYSETDEIWSKRSALLEKIRWCTFGYHYDWGTKLYTEASHCKFPTCLQELSQHVASCTGFRTFKPEAAIVNYYKLGSTLGAHVDNSEIDLDAPLLSFSFGQSAVFLLGAETKDEKPLAMFIRSGDIIIMSGACRLVYHAIPLIIADDAWVERCSHFDDSITWQSIMEDLKSLRINITVRQVFPLQS